MRIDLFWSLVLTFVLTVLFCLLNMAGFESKKDCPDGYDIYDKEEEDCYKCAAGYKYSKENKICWKCPNGYRRNILRRIYDRKVCNKKGILNRDTRRASTEPRIRYTRPRVIPQPKPIRPTPNNKNTFYVNQASDLSNSNIYGNDMPIFLKGRVIDDILNVDKEFELTIELNKGGQLFTYPYELMFHNVLSANVNMGGIYINHQYNKNIQNVNTLKIEYIKTKNNLIVKFNGQEIDISPYRTNFNIFTGLQTVYPKDEEIVFQINKDVKTAKFKYL